MSIKTIKVPVKQLFDIPTIKQITIREAKKHPGNIPVYGGTKTETPVALIEDGLENVSYFDPAEGYLAWNTNGSAGYVFYHKEKFAVNQQQRVLKLKEEYKGKLNLEYLAIKLQEVLLEEGFSWDYKAGKERIEDIEVAIPVKDNGEYNLELQESIVKKYNRLKTIKEKLCSYVTMLKEVQVRIKTDTSFTRIRLGDEKMFSVSIGKRILKKEVSSQWSKGMLAIYSSNPYIPFGYVLREKVEPGKIRAGPALIWGIDGNFEWNYIPEGIEFVPTDHCGVLKINSEFIEKIDYMYLYYQLNLSKNTYEFDRTFRANLENIKGIEVEIPVDNNGNFDIEEQRRIAKRYKKIEEIRQEIIRRLEEIVKFEVTIRLE